MPRLAFSALLALSLLGLTACSKKQEPTPPPTTPPAETAAATESTAQTPREFDFSGKSTNTGPSSPETSVKPGDPEAAPAGSSDMIEVQMPVMVEYYPPFYPIGDRMKGAEGRLLIGLFVTETGAVESPTVISSTMPAYKDEVLRAAANWRFFPATHEGKPIRFPVRIPVNFTSEFGSGGMPPGSPLENIVLNGDTYYSVGADGKFTPANVDVTPLTRVEPVFSLPKDVKELRVALKFKVDEQGRVVDPTVAESSKTDFDKAALKAIRYWQFLPKIKNGKPVTASAMLPLKVSVSR